MQLTSNLCRAQNKKSLETRTKGDAVGRSRMPSSSGERHLRNDECPQRDQQQDDDGEPYRGWPHPHGDASVSPGVYSFHEKRTDGLRDGKGRAERGELQRDVEQDARLAHAAERVARWRERAIREEVEDLLSDAVL
jgi:hypothetical protein